MDKSKLFTYSVCPDASVLKQYAEGKCNTNDVKYVEEHITTCALCSDALEGIILLPVANGFEEIKLRNPYKKSVRTGWMGAGIVLIAAVTSLYIINITKKESVHVIKTEEASVIENNPEPISEEVNKTNDTLVLSENNRENSAIIRQHDSIVIAPAEPIKDVPVIKEIPVLPKQLSITAKSALNVLYIQDLKVIDYSEIYSKYDLLHNAASGGVRAGLENRNIQSNIIEYDTLTSDVVLSKALVSFNKQQYRSVIKLMKLLSNRFPDDMNAQFYSALSYYYLNENAETESLLVKVLAHRNTAFDEEANWYLANAKLNLDKKEAAIALLKSIEKQNGFYAEKASLKLKQLP